MRPTAEHASYARAAARRSPSCAPRLWIAAAGLCLALLHIGAGPASALTIGATENAMLVWIAEERGYFKEQGLDVEIRQFQAGVKAANALIEGKVDISTTSDAGFVTQSFRHPDLRILAVISASDTVQLIGRRDRGIQDAADLAGKRVGVTLGSTSEYLLSRYLIMQGVPETTPVLIDLQPSDIATSLESGVIDAGLTWEPYIRNAELALKDNARILPGQIDQTYYFMLLTRQAWADSNQEQISRFLRALIEAENFAIDKPEDSKRIIQNKFKYTQIYMDYTWHLQNLHISLPQGLMFVLERQAEWQIRHNQTTSKAAPDFLDFVSTAPLAGLRDASVEIVK